MRHMNRNDAEERKGGFDRKAPAASFAELDDGGLPF